MIIDSIWLYGLVDGLLLPPATDDPKIKSGWNASFIGPTGKLSYIPPSNSGTLSRHIGWKKKGKVMTGLASAPNASKDTLKSVLSIFGS